MIEHLEGDCRTILPSLPAASVQCCLSSPPYWGLRSYLPEHHPAKDLEIGQEPTDKEYIDTLVTVFRHVSRVLMNIGTLWLNLGDASHDGPIGKVEWAKMRGPWIPSARPLRHQPRISA
jgi:site-specific DNA-methyltransferase (cytosine-N4-specific)